MAGQTTTRDEVDARIDALEQAMAEEGWCHAVRVAHQERYGISRQQVYNDRRKVLDRLVVEHDTVTPQQRRSDFLERNWNAQRLLRQRIEDADDVAAASLGRAVDALMKTEAMVTGVNAPIEVTGKDGAPLAMALSVPGLDVGALETSAWGEGATDDETPADGR